MDGLTFHLFDVLVIAGILQAVIMAVLLFSGQVKGRPQRLFSWILLTLAALSFKILLHTLGLWDMSLFRYFPLAIDTLLAPLLYLYVLAVTGRIPEKKRVLLSLLPAVMFMLYAIVVYLLALGQSTPLLKDRLADRLLFNPVKTAEDMVAVVTAVIFWLLAFRRITAYRYWLFNSQSDTSFQEYRWLKNLLIVSGLLVLALGIVVFLEDFLKAGRHDFVVLQVFYIYMAVLSYYLSLKGYRLYLSAQPETFIPVFQEKELIARIPTQEITEEQLIIKSKITAALEIEKLYLEPELNLKDLAKHIGFPAAKVSAAINACFRQNFRNLVNHFRVEEVKERLKNPQSHLSLLGIALDSGFNSEASFYRIFRQETGISPNDYLQSLK
jgi:AraC-like DNA-binding protein